MQLTSDDWLWAIGSTPWDPIAQGKMESQLGLLAQDLLRLRVSVVLDFGIWARSERDTLRELARSLGVGVELHYLPVSLDELWRRVHERNQSPPWSQRPIQRADLEGWLPKFEAPDTQEMALFDDPISSA